MRFFVASLFYVFAFVFILSGINAAPDMTWPHTDLEWVSAYAISVGVSLKVLGHAVLADLI